MTKGNAATNARVGRLYSMALTDSAGYPNGMAYWPELSAGEKYHLAATAISFVEYLAREGLISLNGEIGLSSAYGEGACADLLRHFQQAEKPERDAFEARISGMGGAMATSGGAEKTEESDRD